jgi:hypothetical protein
MSLSLSFFVVPRDKTNQMEVTSWTLPINQDYLYSISPKQKGGSSCSRPMKVSLDSKNPQSIDHERFNNGMRLNLRGS